MPEDLIVQLRYATLPFPLQPVSIHYWFTLFDRATEDWERWEVWQYPDRCLTSWGHVHKNLMHPDSGVGGGPYRVQAEWQGDLAGRIREVLQKPLAYPNWNRYHFWPGPNSNTFAAWVLEQSGVACDLDPRGIGKDFRGRYGFGWQQEQRGFRIESPILGMLHNPVQGWELHLLGLTLGFASQPFRIKTPLGCSNIDRRITTSMTNNQHPRKWGEALRQRLLPDVQTPILALVNTSENAKMDRAAAEKAWMKDYKEFGAAGIHVYHAHVQFTNCWLGIKQYDWTELDKVMSSIVKGDPKGRIILRLSLRTPQWWHEKNPDQKIVYHDGTSCVEEHHWNETVYPTSLASKVWMDDVQVLLCDTVAHVEASRHGGHVIGYNPALMHGGEWFEYGALYGKRADFSPVMRDAFRAWLDARYPGEDHSTVEIPTVEERGAGDIGHLRHPVKSRLVIDHYVFYNERVAEDAERCCRTIKEAVTKDALVGIYYGYTFECAVQVDNVEDFGHLALRRILHSPYIDFLTTMNHYWDRPPGGFSWSFGPLADSCRAHDMLFFGEDENMTWLNRRNDSATEIYVWRAPNAEDAINIFKRSFASVATHGQHEAIADLNGGWYDDPEIMRCIADMARITREGFTREEKLDLTPVAEVAVLVDEVSCMYQGIDMANHLNTALLPKALRPIFHMGAPTEFYLFSDLTDGFVPLERFKFIIVLNAFRLTREQREYIRANVQKNGRHILWHYAPGFITEDDASVDQIRDLIGINIDYDLAPSLLEVTADGETYCAEAEVSPTFYAADPDVEVLGRMADGKVGLCSKQLDDSVSIYSAGPRVPASMLQNLARKAGVHIYCDSGNLIHASRGLVAIHAGSDGPKRIVLPRKSDMKDLFNEGDDATNVDQITVDLKLGKTKVWAVRPV